MHQFWEISNLNEEILVKLATLLSVSFENVFGQQTRSLLTVVGGRCGAITVVCPDVIIIVSLIVISTSHEAHTNRW